MKRGKRNGHWCNNKCGKSVFCKVANGKDPKRFYCFRCESWFTKDELIAKGNY